MLSRYLKPLLPPTSLALAFACLLTVATPMRAANRVWGNVGGGTFSDPANWQVAFPGAADSATFNLVNTYAVDFSGNAVNIQLFVGPSNVSFDLNGHTYQLTSTSSELDSTGTVIW
jgi:hypothetical protein